MGRDGGKTGADHTQLGGTQAHSQRLSQCRSHRCNFSKSRGGGGSHLPAALVTVTGALWDRSQNWRHTDSLSRFFAFLSNIRYVKIVNMITADCVSLWFILSLFTMILG